MAIPEACGDPASLWIFYIIYFMQNNKWGSNET